MKTLALFEPSVPPPLFDPELSYISRVDVHDSDSVGVGIRDISVTAAKADITWLVKTSSPRFDGSGFRIHPLQRIVV